MGLIAERLALLISANPDDAIRGLNKLEREAGRSVGATESRVDNLGHSLTRIGAGMLSVGVLGGVGLAKAARATSDLNEAISLTESIFGDASDEIGAFARGASSSIGQSERAAREATATFGGLLDNLGFAQDETVGWSKDLTTLAADLGSAFNTDPADAVQALGSALRGEQEPIRRYNVMLDDAAVRARAVELGLADTAAEVDNNGKAQARLSLIMEQTSSVQGNFADTSDGMANAQRTFNAQLEDFQAALGQGVLPMMEAVLGKGTDFLNWFNEMDPATQKLVSQAATLSAGLLVLGGGLSMVVGQAIKMRDNLKTLTGAVKGNAAAIGAVAVVATVAAMAFARWQREQQKAANRTATFTTALGSHATELEAVNAAVSVGVQDWDGYTRALDAAGLTQDDLSQAIIAGGDELNTMKDRLEAAAVASGMSLGEVQGLAKGVDQMREAFVDGTAELDKMNTLVGEGADEELPSLDQAAADAEAAIAGLGDETAIAAKATADLSREWAELTSELLEGLTVQTDAELLVEDITAAVEELDGKSTAQVTEQVLGFVNQLGEIKGAAADAGEDVSGMSDTAEYGLLLLMSQAGLSEDAIQQVIDTLKALDGLEVNASMNVRRNMAEFDYLSARYGAPTASAPSGGGMDLSFLNEPGFDVNVIIDGEAVATASANSNRRAGTPGR